MPLFLPHWTKYQEIDSFRMQLKHLFEVAREAVQFNVRSIRVFDERMEGRSCPL